LFLDVSDVLAATFVDGNDADPPMRDASLASDIDPVVMTGTPIALTKTGNAPPPRESPPKEPPPKHASDSSDKPAIRQPGTVQTERKIYRPKLPSLYVEPDLGPDLLDGHELIYKEYGHSIRQAVDKLPARTDSIKWDPAVHQFEFDRNIRWGSCPVEHREQITEIIQRHWDCFAEDGWSSQTHPWLLLPCRYWRHGAGLLQNSTRYGPHETPVLIKLCEHLENNDLIEDDYGPYGALIVLAAKANQEDVPWHEYNWRLCVSYRRLNQVVRQFAFPIRRCDDAVADIPPWANSNSSAATFRHPAILLPSPNSLPSEVSQLPQHGPS
jgi:hypothetical protein